MTSRSVDEWHVALEVHLPQLIGGFLLEAMAWIGRRILARLDPLVPTQDPMHGGRYRHRLPIAIQAMGNLACSPSRVLVAQSYDLRLHGSSAALGHPLRTTGLIGQFPIAGLPSPKPLVAHIGTDAEPSAELPPVRSFLQGKSHELASLVHY